MHKNAFRKLASLALAGLAFVSCGGDTKSQQNKEPFRGVYYWRTTYSTNAEERAFLAGNGINRMYVRFFDVDVIPDAMSPDACMPVATIAFADTLPQGMEIVPTVFITPKAIAQYHTFVEKLCRRIYAMCNCNDITPTEVQFDCDWTVSTETHYFNFLKKARKELEGYFSGIKISSTIRLHQLRRMPPPVDRGVLMCYNTGNFRDFHTKNSILDLADIKPYIHDLTTYHLPMDLALPAYGWNVEFDSEKRFYRLNAKRYDFSNATAIAKLSPAMYSTRLADGTRRYIRQELVSAQTILQAKKQIAEAMGSQPNIILYHLDYEQLSNYTKDEISEIYR